MRSLILRAILSLISYLSMMTGSDGVSFLLPQLFLSQHRLQEKENISEILNLSVGTLTDGVSTAEFGRAIAQAVSRCLPTAAAWVRCQVR
jgi:hypothetical protein